MSLNKLEYIDNFSQYTNYFLQCEENWNTFEFDKCNIIFIKIFNSILFEENREKRNKQIAYIIFWINFIIEKCRRKIEEPLLTTLITIINKLDLQQLIQFTSSEHNMDFTSELDYELRKIFDERMALTDSQIKILLSILNKKDIVFSAPTSYGKTGIVRNSLLISLEKGFINNFVAILPTKALINEYRKSINCFFKGKNISYSIIEGPYTEPNNEKNIFLFTQERFLIFNNRFENFKFEYVLFDEAQNLLNSLNKTDNQRHILLAKSLAIVDCLNIPKVFLMPYIRDPYNSFVSKFVNMNTENLTVIDNLFSPTSSLKYLIKKSNNKFKMYDVTFNRGYFNEPKEINLDIPNPNAGTTFDSIKYDLYKICNSKEIDCLDEKNLYYCNKREIRDIAQLFSKQLTHHKNASKREVALINYLIEYIGEDFELIDFIKKGICIHTGDLDSFTKRQIENLFLDESAGVNHIFCTSTLLQGVNMNANNLFFLAKKGSFSNALLDKKNLLGRVGRLGHCLQGRIFRFYVDTPAIKFNTIKEELNSSAEPCEFKSKDFNLPEVDKRNETLVTYLSDKDVNNSITKGSQSSDKSLDCFDYFLGINMSGKIEDKFSRFTSEKTEEIIEALSLKDYNCYKKLVLILSEIYEWSNSNDYDIKNRLSNIDFTTRLFYNVSIGTSVKHFIKNTLEINERNGRVPYVVNHRGNTEVWFLTSEEYKKYKYKYNCDLMNFKESDKNILVYSTLRDINDLIEFRLKMFIQDLYYRLGKNQKIKSENIEDFLTHSLVGNKRKIALKNIGIIDEFALNKLVEKSDLFNDEMPDVTKIIDYAYRLDSTDPIKYAICDVLL